MNRDRLVNFLNTTLQLDKYSSDVSNNGLQVEGKDEVKKIIFGVDARLELFEAAAKENADFIIVHHGLSWGSEPRRFVGITANRLRCLFNNGISLYGVHLPLDAHPELGNNAELSRICDLQNRKPFFEYDGQLIGFSGELPVAKSIKEVAEKFEQELNCQSLVLKTSEREIRKIAIVSGGAGVEALNDAANIGADLLLTGELTHVMSPVAKELGVSVIGLGHYASETLGVKAIKRLLGDKFKLDCKFIDIPTGL